LAGGGLPQKTSPKVLIALLESSSHEGLLKPKKIEHPNSIFEYN
jgi:hypothetical protein